MGKGCIDFIDKEGKLGKIIIWDIQGNKEYYL
jgi:hypothetical protein